ncbi:MULTISPECIES: bifunctional phosphoribosyl-AMP cyclohydrolase/phosphoribosyl-ATP diphosphatase HisIE [unclassified Paenibacillus]|uniref:bifunctional phosphoribosyl-AMP cyclohydrolase/phosphoribosyl-ATP diphosphatase HisIE n=1 Tax=unclassified Paenibacillus TaxID=185978 RepID=UPI002404E81E|nr:MULTISPECIES: bifunctional phosphoribosyl-AMP cyclohydrolase/phosphoribosyl-ATP diphosphatase HisIE [unclassified Paenibacillus]MDF9840721.1 phosphoribosyl-ATP pyrophosphohydrolase/phosphoribosyl-AMP cyclohydrolase [Paenibacillus sp. PastF-2]MDF9847304.1 phosphoribosyl-ATP pyrophosphohydrolase/phosphoribosyl-AMP cyclohydrolase [Paenibacillus sp. PastM-2]MDF9854118.1 phosphoribosyl-ATP pyrophosphohydrolase/phosphoribosyl-AMP cyclohydrolase [Paenibacillus sp. PastF-1]MDH6479391.1 phosphoribosy
MSQEQEAIIENIRWNESGLLPAVVQDARTLEVLMFAYMNPESLRLSLESGQTWFWSRSRSELWHKGGTSGNTQAITSIHYDCDSDTLLVKVVPEGPACHTGENTCFYREIPLTGQAAAEPQRTASADEGRFAVLGELERVIAEREIERPEGAYTTYLFDKGVDKILKKVGEEASETIIAAKNKDNAELRLEVSDLIYHLLVLLQERKLPLDEILEELSARHERPRRD